MKVDRRKFLKALGGVAGAAALGITLIPERKSKLNIDWSSVETKPPGAIADVQVINTEGGVLTREIVEEAAERAVQSFGQPYKYIMPYDVAKAWMEVDDKTLKKILKNNSNIIISDFAWGY